MGLDPCVLPKHFCCQCLLLSFLRVLNKSLIVWVLLCQPVYTSDAGLDWLNFGAEVGTVVPLIDRRCGENPLWKPHGLTISV